LEDNILNIILEYWQVIFLYGLKILNDINKSINSFDKILAIHETEINALKERANFNRRQTDITRAN